MKQQQATLIKQRDEYLRKGSVLRRELEKLRIQKQELLSEKSPPRDSERILRENAKLQVSENIIYELRTVKSRFSSVKNKTVVHIGACSSFGSRVFISQWEAAPQPAMSRDKMGCLFIQLEINLFIVPYCKKKI